jgi:nucleoside-diphosphate-sugar epimerase
MKLMVTGTAGHLGEALARTLRGLGHEVAGLDILPSPYTTERVSIVDREGVKRAMAGVEAVFHAAALHKPHVATHRRQDFVDVNVTGALNLLEEAKAAGAKAFIFTSTTSVFGDALTPAPGAPAAWITEGVTPEPKNIYGVTKAAAEDLCALFHRNHGLPCVVLRTSRFFPEPDDNRSVREDYPDENAKVNELLFRRVDIEDAVSAHIRAWERAPALGFRRYVVSATTPFHEGDLAGLARDAASAVRARVPEFEAEYRRRGWRMFPRIDRVYVNARARDELGWRPRHDFASAIERLGRGEPPGGALARIVGAKGYHAETFADGPYPVE